MLYRALICDMFLFGCFSLFFFSDPAPTEIYTLSLHDALPISDGASEASSCRLGMVCSPRTICEATTIGSMPRDRKSTRLNSSHVSISYAVFCLKKKKKKRSLIESAKSAKVVLDSNVRRRQTLQ